jgi:toxin ParE1/3/4
MAQPSVLWSPEAEADLIGIWRYLASETSSEFADRQLQSLEAAAGRLADWPRTGRSREELAANLRSIVCEPHVIFYRLTESAVQIVRVLHGRRDLPGLFSDPAASLDPSL